MAESLLDYHLDRYIASMPQGQRRHLRLVIEQNNELPLVTSINSLAVAVPYAIEDEELDFC